MKKPFLLTVTALLVTTLAWIGVSLAFPGEDKADSSGIETYFTAVSETAREATAREATAREATTREATATAQRATITPPRKPQGAPLGPHTEKGLAYLANQQQPDGGWGQGGGWRTVATGGRIETADQRYQDAADVANTAIATLALLRSGSTPTDGAYAEHVRKGIDFVIRSVEQSDADSLFVTEVRGTQLQSKIGLYVDTFLANLLLAEALGQTGDVAAEARLETALGTVLAKIEHHQRDDGTFADNQGWASVLSQSIANKGLNRARQAGADVKDSTLGKIRRQASDGYDADRGEFRAGERFGSTAGVKLYEAAASLAALDDLEKTGAKEERELRAVAQSAAAPEVRQQAADRLERLEETRQQKKSAVGTMASRLSDAAFVSGFGSSGGEEYLSYMNISEALAAEGGDEWKRWDQHVGASLAEAQNGDGSWSGHHCITGRTFVTSAALLTLMADRAPQRVGASIQG